MINLNYNKKKLIKTLKALFSIFIGTTVGTLSYVICIILDISILGWNLGLIFAPLAAGYVETVLAKKLINESTGAVSAFILFIITVIYGFLIANTTLGANLITFGAIIVIAQAAMPTFINYFLIVVVLGFISYGLGIFKKITNFAYKKLKILFNKFAKEQLITGEVESGVDDLISEVDINQIDFKFLSISSNGSIEIFDRLGIFEERILINKEKNLISNEFEESKLLYKIKEAEKQALYNLSNIIKKEGGNGVIDLTIEFDNIGIGYEIIQVVARGTGVILKINQSS